MKIYTISVDSGSASLTGGELRRAFDAVRDNVKAIVENAQGTLLVPGRPDGLPMIVRTTPEAAKQIDGIALDDYPSVIVKAEASPGRQMPLGGADNMLGGRCPIPGLDKKR